MQQVRHGTHCTRVERFSTGGLAADVQAAELCSMFSSDLCTKRAIVSAMLPVWCCDADASRADYVHGTSLTSRGELSAVALEHSHPAGLAPRQETDRDYLTALVSAWAASPALADSSRIDAAAFLLEFVGDSV